MVNRRLKKDQKLPLLDQNYDSFTNPEVERRIAAIRAIRDVETDQLVYALRLLRSNFSKEQLQSPLLQFFNDNLPNLQLLDNDNFQISEVKWKENSNVHTSLLHRMSTAYHHPSFSGFELTNKAVRRSSVGAKNFHIRDFGLEERSSQMPGLQDGLQTPGGEFNSQRMSVIGMTPKTQRLPKKGEMLLSIHGSPLGAYNEEQNMEAIRESEETLE